MMNEGTYSGSPTSGTTTTSKQNKPQIAVAFSITHIADGAGEWQDVQPFERKLYISLTDAAWPYSMDRLKAIGFNGDFDNPNFSPDSVALRCFHEEYEGKPKEKWDIITAGAEATKADSNTIRTLSAKWKQAAKPAGAPKPPGKPAAPPAAKKPAMAGAGAAPIDPDEIPFTDGFSPCGI